MDRFDILTVVGFFLITQLLLYFYEPAAFILLGAAFILFAPFIILERHSIRQLRNARIAVFVALLSLFIAGMCWLYAMLLALKLS